jgi:hypothetical protein
MIDALLIETNNYSTIQVYENNEIIGELSYIVKIDNGKNVFTVFSTNSWKKGTGHKIVNLLENIAINRNVDAITLVCILEGSESFWKKQGFTIREDYKTRVDQFDGVKKIK